MKKAIVISLVLIIGNLLSAQDITNSLGPEGKFIVKSATSDEAEFVVQEDGKVGINVDESFPLTSNLNVDGSMSVHIRDVYDSSFNFEDDDYMVYANINSTGTLPDPATANGRLYMVLRDISATLTLEPASVIEGQTVHDNPSSLYSYIYCDGTKWYVYEIASSTDSGLNPGFVVNVERVNSDFTVSPDVQLYHFYGGSEITVTLPSAEEVKGIVYTMTMIEDKASGVDTHFILSDPTETINGATSGTVKNVNYAYVYSDGSNWWAFGYATDPASNSPLPAPISESIVLSSDYDKQTFLVNFLNDDQSVTLTLPPASENIGKTFKLKRNANGDTFTNNTVFVKPSTGEKLDYIDSDSHYIMANDFELLIVESNGVSWMIMN